MTFLCYRTVVVDSIVAKPTPFALYSIQLVELSRKTPLWIKTPKSYECYSNFSEPQPCTRKKE